MDLKKELRAWAQAFRELNEEDRDKRKRNPFLWWAIIVIGLIFGASLVFLKQ